MVFPATILKITNKYVYMQLVVHLTFSYQVFSVYYAAIAHLDKLKITKKCAISFSNGKSMVSNYCYFTIRVTQVNIQCTIKTSQALFPHKIFKKSKPCYRNLNEKRHVILKNLCNIAMSENELGVKSLFRLNTESL